MSTYTTAYLSAAEVAQIDQYIDRWTRDTSLGQLDLAVARLTSTLDALHTIPRDMLDTAHRAMLLNVKIRQYARRSTNTDLVDTFARSALASVLDGITAAEAALARQDHAEAMA